LESAHQEAADCIAFQAGDGPDDWDGAGGQFLACRKEFTTECRDHPLGHRAGHDVAVHRAVFGGKLEDPQDPGSRFAVQIGGCRSEGDGECGRYSIVAVGEVPVEDLSADTGPRNDITDGELIDRAFVRQRQGRVVQLGADAFGARVCALAAGGHRSRVNDIMDK
jgi:hypothetical protein